GGRHGFVRAGETGCGGHPLRTPTTRGHRQHGDGEHSESRCLQAEGKATEEHSNEHAMERSAIWRHSTGGACQGFETPATRHATSTPAERSTGPVRATAWEPHSQVSSVS